MATYYIGADVHATTTDLAFERDQRIAQQLRVPTTIPALREALASVSGTKHLAIEEGPMADWLWRNLKDDVTHLVVCDPRRNRLISDDGDKDDRIDGAKLAALLRGGFLRPVHHPDSAERVELKQWVALYHDRVKQAVREVNKIRMLGRQHGLRVPGRILKGRPVAKDRQALKTWLGELPSLTLAKQLSLLLAGYQAIRRQVEAAKRELGRLAAGQAVVGCWSEVPGVGPIRAVTLLAYLDTPWRFKTLSKLWKYCGVGLERSSSGSDKHGQPKAAHLQLAWRVNRRLKNVVMGATLSAIRQKETPFARLYQRLLQAGLTAGNARHTVARRLLGVLWGMWKTSSRYQPDRV
jgi:transposase